MMSLSMVIWSNLFNLVAQNQIILRVLPMVEFTCKAIDQGGREDNVNET
jgi:hypothetical protein